MCGWETFGKLSSSIVRNTESFLKFLSYTKEKATYKRQSLERRDVVAFFQKLLMYELEIIFSYWYQNSPRWDDFSPAHVPGQSRRRRKNYQDSRSKLKLARRPQTAKHRPVEARETLLRRLGTSGGEPFVAIRALRSSAQLRSEEGGKGKEKKKRTKREPSPFDVTRGPRGQGHGYLSSSCDFIRIRMSCSSSYSILSSTFPLARACTSGN